MRNASRKRSATGRRGGTSPAPDRASAVARHSAEVLAASARSSARTTPPKGDPLGGVSFLGGTLFHGAYRPNRLVAAAVALLFVAGAVYRTIELLPTLAANGH